MYEGTVVLHYETSLPEFHDFLTNFTCNYGVEVCEIHDHLHKLATHILDTLDHSLPHLSDLPNTKERKTRAIEWFGEPLNW